MRRVVGIVLTTIIVIFGLVFAVFNHTPIIIDYVMGTVELPMALAMVLVLFLGMLLGWLSAFFIIMKYKHQVSNLRKAVDLSKTEIENLRKIPLTEHT